MDATDLARTSACACDRTSALAAEIGASLGAVFSKYQPLMPSNDEKPYLVCNDYGTGTDDPPPGLADD